LAQSSVGVSVHGKFLQVVCVLTVWLFRRGYDHERGGGRGGYEDDRNQGRYLNRAPGEDSSHAKFSCRNILIILVIEDLK
jgi:hypothetical protein